MDNFKLYQLMFNRSWATFDNFFPKHILDELVYIVNTHELGGHDQEFRNGIRGIEKTAAHSYFKHQVPERILEWTGTSVELIDWCFWVDHEGLEYTAHTDNNMFSTHEHHVQVYLNDGISQLGTRIHNWLRQPIGQAAYGVNKGIYLNTAQTIIHSVSRVPKDSIRKSVRARYKPKTSTS